MKPLHEAALYGDRTIVEFLLDNTPTDLQTDASGKDWLHYAQVSQSKAMQAWAVEIRAKRWRCREFPALIRSGTSLDMLLEKGSGHEEELKRSARSAEEYAGHDDRVQPVSIMLFLRQPFLVGQPVDLIVRPRSGYDLWQKDPECHHVRYWRDLVQNVVIPHQRVDVLRYLLVGLDLRHAKRLISRSSCSHAARIHNVPVEAFIACLDDLDNAEAALEKLSTVRKALSLAFAEGTATHELDAMLRLQAEEYSKLPGDLRERRRFLLVDFSSPEKPRVYIGLNGRSPIFHALRHDRLMHVEWLLAQASDLKATLVQALFDMLTETWLSQFQFIFARLRMHRVDFNTLRVPNADRWKAKWRVAGMTQPVANTLLQEAMEWYGFCVGMLDTATSNIGRRDLSSETDSHEQRLEKRDQCMLEVRQAWSIVEWLVEQDDVSTGSLLDCFVDAQGGRTCLRRTFSDRGNSKHPDSVGCRSCSYCHDCETTTTKFKRCARCARVWFCSEDCQRACWKFHKASCVPLAHEPRDTVLYEPLLQLVKLLIEHGAEPNPVADDGRNFAQMCVNDMQLALVRWLAKEHGVMIRGLASETGAHEEMRFHAAMKSMQR